MSVGVDVPRGRWRALVRNLSVSAASLLVTVAVLEGVFRLLGYGNLEIYDPDPSVYWRLRPNQSCFTKVGHEPVHVNAHGTRGPDFAVPKPPGTLRIVSLGDSRTFGWGLADGETYSAVLERALRDRLGDSRRVEVVNAGVNAWSHAQMKVFFRDVALAWQPDVVVIGGANQWTQFGEDNSPEFVREFMWRVRLKNLLRRSALYHYVVELQLERVYERERTRFIPVDPAHDALFVAQQQHDPNGFFAAQLTDLCRLALAHGVQPILLRIPTLDDLAAGHASDIDETTSAVGGRLDVPVVDFTPDLAWGAGGYYLDADPVHLNVAGNAILGRRLAKELLPELALH